MLLISWRKALRMLSMTILQLLRLLKRPLLMVPQVHIILQLLSLRIPLL